MALHDIIRKVKLCLVFIQLVIVVITLLRSQFGDIYITDELTELLKNKNLSDNIVKEVYAKYNAGPLESNRIWNNCVMNYLKLKKYVGEEQSISSIVGQEKVKTILWSAFLNKDSELNSNICLFGRQGTGKTEIITKLASSSGRKFQTISLCGRDKHNTLQGNNTVYKSSSYGPITKCLLDSNCSNPIIFIDEVDKADPEIQNSLLMILDNFHKSNFTDHFLEPLPVDLSDVTFVFACNDKSKLIQPLQDRLSFVEIEELPVHQILKIGRNFFKEQNINMSSDTVNYLYDNFVTDKRSIRSLIVACKRLLSYINLKQLKSFSRKNINDCFDIEFERVPKSISDGVMVFQPSKKLYKKRNTFVGYVGKLGSV